MDSLAGPERLTLAVPSSRPHSACSSDDRCQNARRPTPQTIIIRGGSRGRRDRSVSHHDDKRAFRTSYHDERRCSRTPSPASPSPARPRYNISVSSSASLSLEALVYDKENIRRFLHQLPQWRQSVTGAHDWQFDDDITAPSSRPDKECPRTSDDGSKLSVTEIDRSGHIIRTGSRSKPPIVLQTEQQYNKCDSDFLSAQLTEQLSEPFDVESGALLWATLKRFDANIPHLKAAKLQRSEDSPALQPPYGRYIQAIPATLLCRAILDMRAKLEKEAGIGFIHSMNDPRTGPQRLLCDRFSDGTSLFGTSGITQVLDLSALTCLNEIV